MLTLLKYEHLNSSSIWEYCQFVTGVELMFGHSLDFSPVLRHAKHKAANKLLKFNLAKHHEYYKGILHFTT